MSVVALACRSSVDEATIRRFLPRETEDFARAYLDSLRTGSVEFLVRMLAPPLDTMSAVRDSIMRLRSEYPPGEPETIEIAALNRTSFSSGLTRTDVSFQTRGPQGAALTDLTILEELGIRRVSSARAQRLSAPLQITNAFTFRAKDVGHYIVLLVLVGVVVFSLFVGVLVARTTAMPRRWLWVLVAAIGTGKMMFNWTTGTVGTQLLSVQFLSATVFRIGILGPWILAVSFPAGALLALERRRHFLRKVAAAGQQSHSEEQHSAPAASAPLSNEEL